MQSVADKRLAKNSIYFHTDRSRQLWLLGRSGSPRLIENIEAAGLDERTTARVIAFSWNTDLILQLDELVSKHQLANLQVASPLSIAHRNEPDEILWDACKESSIAPSAGGWHTFGDLDRPTYQLTALGDAVTPSSFWGHFLHKPLSFVTGCDVVACARVVAALRDPRWFVAPDRPVTNTPLRTFLRIRPDAQQQLHRHAQDDGIAMCRRVMACWGGLGNRPPGWADDPRCFLWRLRDQFGGEWKGDLRASQRFIEFLRQVWLQKFYPHIDFFSPELFFEPFEAQAYRSFVTDG